MSLAKFGYKVRVFEKTSSPSTLGAGLQLSPNAIAVFRQLGIYAKLQKYATVVTDMSLRNASDGGIVWQQNLAKLNFNADYCNIHRADLYRCLLDNCVASGVEVIFDTAVIAHTQNSNCVQLTLSNSIQLTVALLVAADGIRSDTYKQIYGDQNLDYSGYIAWRCLLDLTKDDSSQTIIWTSTNAHLVQYPIRNNSLLNIVAVTKQKNWQNAGYSSYGSVETLKSNFKHKCTELNAVLNRIDKIKCWGLYSKNCINWGSDRNRNRNRVIIIGDAGHLLLPHLAQGAAMAIEDGYQLAVNINNYGLISGVAKLPKMRTARIQKVKLWSVRNIEVFSQMQHNQG